MVTDAGMPGISDPGERLVRAAVDAGGHGRGRARARRRRSPRWWRAGCPTGRFVFEGFLPRKGSGRTERLAAVGGRAAHDRALRGAAPGGPHPRRPRGGAAAATAGSSVARELTKLHEEVWRGTLAEAVGLGGGDPAEGELVLVLEGAPPAAEPTDDEVEAALRRALADGATARDAATEVAAALDVPRKRAYRIAIGLD